MRSGSFHPLRRVWSRQLLVESVPRKFGPAVSHAKAVAVAHIRRVTATTDGDSMPPLFQH